MNISNPIIPNSKVISFRGFQFNETEVKKLFKLEISSGKQRF